jgi:hypothetical protein
LQLAEEIFNEAAGKEYDASELFQALRKNGKQWFFELTDAIQANAASSKPLTLWEILEKGLKLEEAAAQHGGKTQGAINLRCRGVPGVSEAFALFIAAGGEDYLKAMIGKRIRRKDGKPFNAQALLGQDWVTAFERVVKEKHGGLEMLEKKGEALLARVLGQHLGRPRQWGSFVSTLTLPGEIVESNGVVPDTRQGGMCCAPSNQKPSKECLPSSSSRQWNFASWDVLPPGLVMEARSLSGNADLQTKLFGRETLTNPESACRFRDLMIADKNLQEVMGECRKAENLVPLATYRKVLAKGGDRDAQAHLEWLLDVLKVRNNLGEK